MPRPRQQSLPLNAAAEAAPPPNAAAADRPLFPAPLVLATTLGTSPELQSCNDLAEALRCVGVLDTCKQTIEATREAELQRIRDSAAVALHVQLAAERLTFDEFRKRLIAAIERFIPERKADVFTGETQTAKFAAGSVSWKRVEPTVRVADDTTKDEIAERLASRKQLTEAIQKLLQRLKLDGWLRVSVTLDLAGIQQRFKDGQLKSKQLPAGLVATTKSESITVKPLPQPERSDVAA